MAARQPTLSLHNQREHIARCLRTVWIELKRCRYEAACAAIQRHAEAMHRELNANDNLTDFGLDVRIANSLEQAHGILSLADLAATSHKTIARTPNLGVAAMSAIKAVLENHKHLVRRQLQRGA